MPTARGCRAGGQQAGRRCGRRSPESAGLGGGIPAAVTAPQTAVLAPLGAQSTVPTAVPVRVALSTGCHLEIWQGRRIQCLLSESVSEWRCHALVWGQVAPGSGGLRQVVPRGTTVPGVLEAGPCWGHRRTGWAPPSVTGTAQVGRLEEPWLQVQLPGREVTPGLVGGAPSGLSLLRAASPAGTK